MSSLRKNLINKSRKTKQLIVVVTDLSSLLIATYCAIALSRIELSQFGYSEVIQLLWVPFFSVFIFYLMGVYNSIMRYLDFSFMYVLVKSFVLILFFTFFFRHLISSFEITSFFFVEPLISYTGWAVGILTSLVLIIGSRIFANFLFSLVRSSKRVLIYGAGSAGIQLAGALRSSSEMRPIAFIDADKSLHNTFLGGLKVYSPNKIERLLERHRIDEVLLAMPSASKSVLNSLLKEIENMSIRVRILPGLSDLAQGKVLVSELKEVEVTDLLGRYEVEANNILLQKNITNKVVLITGAGGSIGSEISRQVLTHGPKKVLLLDSSEFGLYQIKQDLDFLEKDIEIVAYIGNVLNKKRVRSICNTHNVDTIYHTAAYKHVPLVESNPFEGVYNNIFGTKFCLEAAIDESVETFVLISTDKAVRPTNIMGATKRFAEMILQAYSDENSKKIYTRMTMVRFGNVLGSSGSAIPLFQKQIKDGGPVTVTHPEITRYFMSISEAAELVIQAGAMGEGGDVFVLDMGDPVKIMDLAERLIRLNGLEVKNDFNLDGDVEIMFTGLRPGEKLYEELLIGDNVRKTEHSQIYQAKESHLNMVELNASLKKLEKACEIEDINSLKEIFEETVHGYKIDDNS